jgi:hypothetical protein
MGWIFGSIILSGSLIYYYVCYAIDRLPTAIELDIEGYVFRFFLGSSFLLCVLVGITGATNVFRRRTTRPRLICYFAAGIGVIASAEAMLPVSILLFPIAVLAILYSIGGLIACFVEGRR